MYLITNYKKTIIKVIKIYPYSTLLEILFKKKSFVGRILR